MMLTIILLLLIIILSRLLLIIILIINIVCKQRGLPEDVVAWRQDPQVLKDIHQHLEEQHQAGGGGGGEEDGEDKGAANHVRLEEGCVNLSCDLVQEQMNIPRYLHR